MADGSCKMDGCRRGVLARGLCQSHYYKAKRSGTLDELAPHTGGTCAYCRQPIPATRRWGAKFCSVTCKQADADASASAARAERRAARIINCAWCRERLNPTRSDTRFCSRACSDAWHNHQTSLRLLQARKAARKPCEICAGPIPDSRPSNSVYCSPTCKTQAGRSGSTTDRIRQRNRNRQHLYGLSNEDFDALLARQGGCCAICSTTEWTGRGPNLDHDHATGTSRGVLCHDCNLGLGNFADDPARLRAAAEYLEAR